jgi:hypothetical protein
VGNTAGEDDEEAAAVVAAAEGASVATVIEAPHSARDTPFSQHIGLVPA